MIGGLALLAFGLAFGGAIYAIGRYSNKAQQEAKRARKAK